MVRQIFSWSIVVLLVIFGQVVSHAQTPTVDNACQLQVEEQYRQLTTDGKWLTGIPGLPWPQQLLAMASKVRTLHTECEVRESQEKLAVANIAELVDLRYRLQQDLDKARQQLAPMREQLDAVTKERDTLKTEFARMQQLLEHLSPGSTAPPPPPSN